MEDRIERCENILKLGCFKIPGVIMLNQIFKFIFVYLALMANSLIGFGQFLQQSPREGRIKGKVDSVVFKNYNISRNGNAEVIREFNDWCRYIYDLKGGLAEGHFSDEEEMSSGYFREVHSYSADGYLNSVVNYSKTNELDGEETYTFDPSKREVQVKEAKIVTTVMQLDGTGKVIKTTNYHDSSKLFSTLDYKYDAKGLCIESVQTWSKSPAVQKIIYEYDTNQNLIKETTYNNSKLSATYTYAYSKFDQYRNWLMQRSYRNGKLESETERSVSYQLTGR